MGKNDLTQSDYFENNDRFADIFNGALFEGEQVIKAEELQEADSVITVSVQDGNGHKVICDKVKQWKGLHLAIFSLENQSYIDYRMVLRAMKSEAIGYDRQWRDRMQNNKKNWKQKKIKVSQHEFLSGIMKSEKFIPIVSLVVYLGTKKKWDGALSLHDMLNIEDKLKPYVSNYKLNLFDYHDCDDCSIFKTENRALFEILMNSDKSEELTSIMKRNEELYSNLDYDSIRAITQVAGISVDLGTIRNKEKGGYNMCKAFDDQREFGRQEGIKEGIKESELSAIRNVMKNLQTTAERAMQIMEIPQGRQDVYAQMLK